MEKKYEDDELDKLINEQFLNEAHIMEEALFSDDDTEDYEASDEEIKASYQQLVARLKADGVYREDGEDAGRNTNNNGKNNGNCDIGNGLSTGVYVKNIISTTNMSNTLNESDKVISVFKKSKTFHKVGKVAGIVVVSGLCVFAASMTSEANRNYFVRNVKYLVGDRTKIVIGNDEGNEDVNANEYEAVNDIEEQLGIDVPEFLYYPKGFQFYKYYIDTNTQSARIEYKYGEYIIEFHMDRVDEQSTSKFESRSGDEINKIEIQGVNINVAISKVQEINDELPSYVGQWKNGDVFYCISGKIEIEEFEKILKNMRGFS